MNDPLQALVDQAFSAAVGLHQAGRLAEAEAFYRKILEIQPDHAEALHHAGLLAHQAGRGGDAVALIQRALASRPRWAEAHYNLGTILLAAGQAESALDCFRHATRARRDFTEAHLNLGNTLVALGRAAEGVSCLLRAVQCEPGRMVAHYNLGNAQRLTGDLPGAEASYRRALALAPDLAEAYLNLALVLQDQGRNAEAEDNYRQALAVRPNFTAAHVSLGTLLAAQGQGAAAEACFRAALVSAGEGDRAGEEEALINLGDLLQQRRDWAGAEQCYRAAMVLRPEDADTLNKLGVTVHRQERYSEAAGLYVQALALAPDSPRLLVHLGAALFSISRLGAAQAALCREQALAALQAAVALDSGYWEAHVTLAGIYERLFRLEDAAASFRTAIALRPEDPVLPNSLGQVLARQGLVAEAIAAHDRAVALAPDDVMLVDNSIFLNLLNPALDNQQLYALIRERLAGINAAQGAAKARGGHETSLDPVRILRVGFVSSSLMVDMNIYYFMADIIAHTPRDQIAIYIYGDGELSLTTLQAKYAGVTGWRNTVGLSLDDVDALIRSDGIDILVQVLGRAYNNDRSMSFLHRRSAPVQAVFHASMTSGLDAVDYFITDARLNPRHSDERLSERALHLPRLFNFPRDKQAPPVVPPPCLTRGGVSFGFFGSSWKLNPAVTDLWAEILTRLPDARLVLKGPGFAIPEARTRQLETFTRRGIDPGRIVFMASTVSEMAHLETYGETDISLDPFPYCGGNSTLESLWMGVPVITLAGSRFIGRMSLSILHTVGLPELAAGTPEDYVALTVALAQDTARLAMLRVTLRERMLTSPLADGPGYARSLTRAFRAMWRRYCVRAGGGARAGA